MGLQRAIPLRQLFCVFCLDKRLQVIKAGRPEGSILFQPVIDCAKRFGIEVVETVPSFTVLVYQMRTTKQTQMLRNGGPRYGKRLGNLTGWLASFAEQIQ